MVYFAHSTEEDFRNSFLFSNLVSPLFKKWIIKCYSLGDIILTPTEYSKKLLEAYGFKQKIYAVSNGIEINKFKKDTKLGQEFRKKYNYTKEDKVIIGIGLYIERKGILDFVALATARDTVVDDLGRRNRIWSGNFIVFLSINDSA